MKILFIVPYCSKGPSNRYRVEQYLPYLKAEGIGYDISPFVFSKFYDIIYLQGRYFKKTIYFLTAFFKRIMDMFKLYKYDLVFIHREACPFGPPIFEWLAYKLKKPIVFDFDDAIFLENYNPVNRVYKFLKFPSKTKTLIRLSKTVIVANQFLYEYARKFNSCVYIIPTSIDTEKLNVIKRDSWEIVIGWIGSPTTSCYLRLIYNVMRELSRRYSFILKIVGAEKPIFIHGVKVENFNWSMDREVSDFQNIDIGIYPLFDTLWVRGKAGFKAIQYMAVGVPVVASSVGMNKDIIQDGVNGFLAGSEEEWVDKISRLIEDPVLRKKIGLAGRRTVEENFSIKLNAQKLLDILERKTSKPVLSQTCFEPSQIHV